MASINKLSIRGVRAFSPDDQEQVVEFFFPLTIICGANGCGKTTIIESLKFALSGAFPPGGGSRSAGQSFVHDPRSVGATTVKANVKLRFTNRAGSSMVVIRSMEVTQKKTSMTFRQLDGVIRTIDSKTGERVTLSHKCGELDKQIPSLLGVSKAILDYVLFVHQEDSSWPLQEAAVLKKRFDDIFDSTRYTKALDSFRKTKKELALKSKDIKAEVTELSAHKHAAKGFRKELNIQEQNLEDLETEKAKHEKEIQAANEEKAKLWKIMEAVSEVREQLNQKRMEANNLRAILEKQRKMLSNDLAEGSSLEDLENKLRDFDKEVKNEKARYDELLREQKNIEGEIEDLRRQEMRLNSSKGKVAAEKEAQSKRLKDRMVAMEKIAQTYSLDLQHSMTQLSARLDNSFVSLTQGTAATSETAQELSKEDMRLFFKTLDEKEEELKQGLRDHKVKFRTEEEEFNTQLQELVGNKNALDNERTKLSNETKDIDNELKNLSATLGARRMKKSSLDDFREQKNQAAKELEKLLKQDVREILGGELRGLNDKIEGNKDKIESLQRAKKRLKGSANLQAKIKLMKETCTNDSKSLYESINAKLGALKSFDIEVPDDLPDDPTIVTSVPKIADSVDTVYQRAKRRAVKATEKFEKARQSQANQSAACGALKQALVGLEKRRDLLKQPNQSVGKTNRVVSELKANDVQVEWNVLDHEPQELLDLLDGYLQEIEEDSPEGIPVNTLLKVLKKIRAKGKKDSACPCCSRAFEGEERKQFNAALKMLGDKEKSPLLEVDSDQKNEWLSNKEKVDKWRKTVYNSMSDLNEYRRIVAEISEKEKTLEHREGELQALNADVEKLLAEVSAANEGESQLRDLSELSKRWREQADRIEEQSTNIDDKELTLEGETAGSVGGQTLDEVEEELQKLLDEQGTLYDKVSKTNKKISGFNTDLSAAQAKAASMADIYARKEEKFAEEQKAAQRKEFLDERKTTLYKEVSKLGEQIASLLQKIKAKEAEKGRLYSHSNDEEIKLNETLNLFLSDSKHLKGLHKNIEEFENSNKEGSLEQIAVDVAKVTEKIKEKHNQCNEVKQRLESASKVVDDQERQKKVLRDSIDYLESEAQLKDIENRVLELEKEEAAVEGANTCYDLHELAEKRINASMSKVNELMGRRNEILSQIHSLRRKLQAPEYKNVDREYKEANIKMETTQMAAKDLEKYSQALDKALLRFHSIKIAEINKIIQELWIKCYQGRDIDGIEIESDADSKAAKSYNYRVVMSKSGTKMDMRGRCSAGQRVLASIVIRLALAETFGIQCGALVLDEPTVNLDENNKRGLAQAMAQIIQSRSAQSNFQLVLITHDEDFVSMMKDELSTQTGFSLPERYFQVCREESHGKWYSKIYGVDWDELL